MKPTRLEFAAALRSQQGAPYLWGGKGSVQWTPAHLVPLPYLAFDCLGLGFGCLHQLGGPDHRWRYNCSALVEALGAHGGERRRVDQLQLGDALFFASSGRIDHVEWWLGEGRVIGARGGGRTTLTLDEALRRGAHVSIRHLSQLGRPLAALRSMSLYLSP